MKAHDWAAAFTLISERNSSLPNVNPNNFQITINWILKQRCQMCDNICIS